MIPSSEKIVEIELADVADALAKKYGCRASVGCIVNNVGRKDWSVGFDTDGQVCEAGSLTEAIERAGYGQETVRQKVKRLRREATDAIAQAKQLEAELRRAARA